MKIIDIINRAAAANKTRFTFELLPPLKGEGPGTVFDAIDTLAPLDPAYINVTFHREDTLYNERADGLLERRTVRHRPGTVGISAAISKRYAIETVPHIICGGQSLYDIEDALIDMDLLGMHNVLALRGDARRGEGRFEPHPHGHPHAEGLVAQITDMNRGRFIDSCSHGGPGDNAHHTDFCVGVAGYPEKHAESPNPDADMDALKRKVDAGADYIVTQMCFDNDRIFSFIDRARRAGITVPIVPGIKPLASRAHLTVLPRTFNVDLPADLVREVERQQSDDSAAIRRVGIEWAATQAEGLKKAGLPVIHFYSMGRTDNIAAIVRRVF
ncbi:MAG: methylenetetrahydrofolate reductase [Alistipes sp.]|jgi:methylenetetrahydrofolate reductase (NADPH)|nr:methylenetetrahydrofolate reductase [Alistipes sp.]